MTFLVEKNVILMTANMARKTTKRNSRFHHPNQKMYVLAWFNE